MLDRSRLLRLRSPVCYTPSMELLNNPTLSLYFTPVLIFFMRITDVSIGTLRIMMVAKGRKLIAPALGFVEILIWLYAISNIVQNADNVWFYLAYGAGFAAGNYLGILVEERLAIGIGMVRVVTRQRATGLIGALRSAGYGVTTVVGEGADGPVDIIYTVVRRAEVPAVIEEIHRFNPRAFYVVEDVRSASVVHGTPAPAISSDYMGLLRRRKKEKG